MSSEKVAYVGNGGGGLAGLLEHLAADFHQTPVGRDIDIVWIKAHTDENFDFLKDTSNPMQLALTYDPKEEKRLADAGVLETPGNLVFLDHFQVVGPDGGLSRLGLDESATSVDIARAAAKRGRATGKPTWLFREGESATSTRTRELFQLAGAELTPSDFDSWMVEFDAYPSEALEVATVDFLLMLTDVGTTRSAGWLDGRSGTGLTAHATGTNSASDPLLNPCNIVTKAGLAQDDPARIFAG